jgi:predicted secreted protein
MTCEANVTKGKQLVFEARTDADDAWEIIGGVQDRGQDINNPTEEVTSSSTTTDYSEREWTGFSDATVNITGVADKRTGITDPATGLNIVGFPRLKQLATTGNRCGKFRFRSIDATLPYSSEGFFNITNLNISGSTPGLVNFSATLESKADVTIL